MWLELRQLLALEVVLQEAARRPHRPLCFLASTSSAPSLTDPQASVARRLKPLVRLLLLVRLPPQKLALVPAVVLVPALALAPHLQEAARLVD